ncbi:YchJ family protein [Moraxella nasovis]|uniref:YchJ family protein n=1 Tax=Moraxella nasovis TaxID=2904121 RepID=UPI001F61801D|nr:YchJ family protein [Moraxella nasovis]UNU73624.1 YchJ family protein [Moraxella nasovis]
MSLVCPCGGDGGATAYDDCCRPFHIGGIAPTANKLMRSRFSAFVLKNIDYIIDTTLPTQQEQLDKAALQAWADEMHWTHLQIKNHFPKIGKRHATVHFCAYFDNGMGKVGCHDELSAFVWVQDRWYFLDPTLPIHLTNKQPCLCGSGEKFKACCAKFLF